jgi:hypothetical protein
MPKGSAFKTEFFLFQLMTGPDTIRATCETAGLVY